MIPTTIGEEEEEKTELMLNHKIICTNLQVTHRRDSSPDGEMGASEREKKAVENPSREDRRKMSKSCAEANEYYRLTSHRHLNCIHQMRSALRQFVAMQSRSPTKHTLIQYKREKKFGFNQFYYKNKKAKKLIRNYCI